MTLLQQDRATNSLSGPVWPCLALSGMTTFCHAFNLEFCESEKK
jgi:hypothetical protein